MDALHSSTSVSTTCKLGLAIPHLHFLMTHIDTKPWRVPCALL
jgi:hypothetical protein